MVLIQAFLFVIGIGVCAAGFQVSAYAARNGKDWHILTGAAVAFAGAGLSAFGVTWALSI